MLEAENYKKKVAIVEMYFSEKTDTLQIINNSRIVKVCKFGDTGKPNFEHEISFFFTYGILAIDKTHYIILIEHYKNKFFPNFLKNLQKFERKDKLKKLAC